MVVHHADKWEGWAILPGLPTLNSKGADEMSCSPKCLSDALEEYRNYNQQNYDIIHKFDEYFGDSLRDAFFYYQEWRANSKQSRAFLGRLLNRWGVRTWIPEYSASTLKKIVNNGLTKLIINDEATLSIAICELLIEGKIRRSVKDKAVICIRRQTLDFVFEARGYADKEEALLLWVNLEKLIEKS